MQKTEIKMSDFQTNPSKVILYEELILNTPDSKTSEIIAQDMKDEVLVETDDSESTKNAENTEMLIFNEIAKNLNNNNLMIIGKQTSDGRSVIWRKCVKMEGIENLSSAEESHVNKLTTFLLGVMNAVSNFIQGVIVGISCFVATIIIRLYIIQRYNY